MKTYRGTRAFPIPPGPGSRADRFLLILARLDDVWVKHRIQTWLPYIGACTWHRVWGILGGGRESVTLMKRGLVEGRGLNQSGVPTEVRRTPAGCRRCEELSVMFGADGAMKESNHE